MQYTKYGKRHLVKKNLAEGGGGVGAGGRLEPLGSVNNILLDLHNSLHPTQPHSIIPKC